jgi:dipeptidyl aminopeptidase/acylaminoacyl peptidase
MGNRALYVIRPDGSGLKQITDGSVHVWRAAWSPDGRTIAFAGLGGPIWLVNPDGSNIRRITNDDGNRFIKDLGWSPDGKAIAYATEGPDPEGSGPPGSAPQDFQIRIVGRDGVGERTIYRCSDLCRFGGYAIEWSPDGKEIAFSFGRVRRFGIVWHIAMVAPDGSGFRVLDTHSIQVRDFSWADGS